MLTTIFTLARISGLERKVVFTYIARVLGCRCRHVPFESSFITMKGSIKMYDIDTHTLIICILFYHYVYFYAHKSRYYACHIYTHYNIDLK
jgi:hypothetical protein